MRRGSMQGHRKYSDGLSDTSSSGSFMDDTDREVSNFTDRAFRSLCIGQEAIYNDSELFSSPTERHKAFAEETQQKTISHEALSYSIQQYGEAEVQSEMASTFQHSYVDVTHQEQAFREGSLSYMNNGSKEVTWQQSRSTSRVSSLIKAFSSGECYHDSGTCDVILARDRYKDFGSESWDKSDMLSIQRELQDLQDMKFSSGYHQNFKSGPFQSYRNHFYTSDVAATVAQMDTTVLMKSSKSKFKALNSTNCFFHSEFSPFQLWEEYNRFSFQSTNVSGFMSASEFPRWYDSPMYKELKDNHRIPNSPCESRSFNQRQIQDVVASQRSRSTVVQKASAIEKRCESEMASNYPPWKKNNNLVRNKLPGNRPSTVSPTNERTCRPDSNLFRNNKVTHEIVVESNLPSSVTPFNITQLLTPVIHTRQETETSEILQFAHTPSVSDYSSQGETDPKLQTDVKHLRDSYKSKASSLLFNLKDNRKRVKSTYSPTRFKGLEITDRNKQTSKLEGRESRVSDIFVFQETAQENLIGMDARASCNLIREPSAAPITPKDYTDGFGSYDNFTLTSPQTQDRVGLAKQGILARNATKARGTINNDSQEGHSVKKEITADKLNHLFEDITYSSVTQYKEQIKLHNDHPKNRSPPSTEIQPLNFEDNQNAVPEKKDGNVKYKPLAIERQKDKHPADDKEMKETLDRRATVENNAYKNYQPSRISEDKQIIMTSSENINTNKESAKQSHEMSPGESMSGHLTATVKTYREKYTSHNPPAQHNEKQTVQHDQKENLYESSQSQYTSSENAVTKPADIIKEDLHVTSTETTKSNSGLNKNSLLGLEKNTPRVEEAYVHLKSKITAAVEQSKNEPIKNSSGIAASKLTSSSSDIKFKYGIPPAKRLMEPSKSELTSNLQTNMLNVDPEQLINRTYKHNSGVNSDSEDMENCTASLTDVANISVAFMPKHESYRDTYQRPASACYERPESSCYERPESACSDMKPFGKPPAVPQKSEKALRRAQRLTTRRMKKAETPKMAPENQEQLESKSIRNVSGVPSSPSDTLSTHLAVQVSPPLSQYDIQPNYTPPAHSIVAQPFPVTQRKLLQDPNSGQYFMVDVPLPVKTKTFYDPVTGKYVQLNVRQRSQGALTQPASLEILNTPYMLYRGLLPMAASSLTPLRSSSEMSTPADNQDMLERGSEPWSQNENSINNNERHTDIITMSELEDFAMEST
uniref:Uncharacterized LOC107673947 n=1 Tax=Sinocyclocheilus anshuiensis TaxID=1608454 RepID=A0A671PQC6_9TELE